MFMEEITRSKVQLQRIIDEPTRQAMFARRKQGLVKKAMELSVLCDCDVGLIIFGPGSGPGHDGSGFGGPRLYQYSSVNMDELLERYAAAVVEPHERRKPGELLRHYYELPPNDEGHPLAGNGPGADGHDRNGGPLPSTSAPLAHMGLGMVPSGPGGMAPLDGMVMGPGGGAGAAALAAAGAVRRASLAEGFREGSMGPGGLKRTRTPSPGLGGAGELPGGMVPQLGGLSGLGLPGGLAGAGLAAGPGPGSLQLAGGPLMPPPSQLPASVTPLRRVAGGLPLEGIKAAGFLDKRNYPVSPRSEKAYEELTAEFDKLTALRSRRGGGPTGQSLLTGLQPLSSSSAGAGAPAGFSLAAQQQQLQALLQQQQALQQQRQQQHQSQQQQQLQPGSATGGGAKRFKPLSIMVPEIASQPIIPTHLTPLTTAGSGPHASSAAAAGGSQPLNGLITQQHPGLPPRPPQGAPAATQPSGRPGGAGPIGRSPSQTGLAGVLSSAATAAASLPVNTRQGLDGPGASADPMPMDLDGSGGLPDRRAGGGGTSGGGADDGLGPGPFHGLAGSFPFRTSIDGSAANLLSMPSPLPHGGAAAMLFGSLDGGPLSIRSGSHGLLSGLGGPSSGGGAGGGLGLGLERGGSLGLGQGSLALGLESPGGAMGLDAALRGLAPMEMLDWPAPSPRDRPGPGGGGGFPDEAEGEGDGGTLLAEDAGLVVRGTSLAKLAPHALEAALGPSPGGTPAASAAAAAATRSGEKGGLAATGSTGTSGAFANATSAAVAASAATDGPDSNGRRHGAVEPGPGEGPDGGRGGGVAEVHIAGARVGQGHGGLTTPELSFKELSSSGGSGLDIAAAAEEAGAALEHAQLSGGEALAGLEVVGVPLVLPQGVGTNAGAQGGA